MNATILSVISVPSGINFSNWYSIGAIITLIILGYLLYSLLKPEKF